MKNNKPRLPVAAANYTCRVTVGPMSVAERLEIFDELLLEFHLKEHLSSFLERQERIGRFSRPVINARSLARTIVKHGRKAMYGTRPIKWHRAVYNSGLEILDFYASKKGRWHVKKAFEHEFESMFPGYATNPQIAKANRHVA